MLPVVSTTQIASKLHSKAILEPSGDHEGLSALPGPAPKGFVTACSFDPSALAIRIQLNPLNTLSIISNTICL